MPLPVPAILGQGVAARRDQAVIFKFPRDYPADAVEHRVADAAAARLLVRERSPAMLDLLARRRDRLAELAVGPATALIVPAENTLLIGYCRLAFRHGSWGDDFHHYHNESHIVEILDGRLDRLIEAIGVPALSARDWFLLALFAACHDLRQRETPLFAAGIGSNERASIEETFRILRVCGFSPEAHGGIFDAIELMIAGSTFDARPTPSQTEYNTAEQVQSGGALAAKLDQKLDKHKDGWRNDPDIVHALDMAQLAADLDTANVAEPFPKFCATADRLCREREMRSHRSLDDPTSAEPVRSFLSEGQERFFFELHRFNSELGRAAFAAGKQANAIKLKALSFGVRNESAAEKTGAGVLEIFRKVAASLG
jgi:hypothetical protein